jgi:hypothetical protein
MSPVRRRLAALALVLALPTLGACGFGYQTDQVYQPGVGVNSRSGDVDILGAVVVSGSDGAGTFVTTFVNKDSDKPATLTSITGEDGLQLQIVKPVKVEADGVLNLASLGAIGVSGDGVKAGAYARLTLEFDTGQKTEVNVPVVDKDEEFSGISPALPASSPSASPSGSSSAGSSPSESPSESPSASPSAGSSESPAP